MARPLDGISPEDLDNISDIIWIYTADDKNFNLRRYREMKADLLAYFKSLEIQGKAYKGAGIDFIEHLDRQYGDLT